MDMNCDISFGVYAINIGEDKIYYHLAILRKPSVHILLIQMPLFAEDI